VNIDNGVVAPAGMRVQEYARIGELLNRDKPKRTLEIGMANGGSTVQICNAHKANGVGGQHTAIDPFQSAETGWKGAGHAAVAKAGYTNIVRVIEDFDYLALPQLVRDRERFDFVLIDGWHSFDYTLVDFFYTDLLLEPGGVLVIHDTGWPAVHKVCRFIETHKPYDLLSPSPSVALNGLFARMGRRFGQMAGLTDASAAKSRRTEWFSLAAYRKRSDQQVADDFHATF